jgi:hypothetical protein
MPRIFNVGDQACLPKESPKMATLDMTQTELEELIKKAIRDSRIENATPTLFTIIYSFFS